ncbi:hypothetical protein C0993_012428 [Termitomyces sp. T159_Od127]|nr:hypothetical protein C0993_012428 [Termitomyces sp. T159_Od127]
MPAHPHISTFSSFSLTQAPFATPTPVPSSMHAPYSKPVPVFHTHPHLTAHSSSSHPPSGSSFTPPLPPDPIFLHLPSVFLQPPVVSPPPIIPPHVLPPTSVAPSIPPPMHQYPFPLYLPGSGFIPYQLPHVPLYSPPIAPPFLPQFLFQPLLFYTPPSSFSYSDPCSDFKLPPLGSIPKLTSSADWGNWIGPVLVLIDQMGLNGHICPLLPPGSPFDPTCKVAMAPPLPPHCTQAESRAYELFWQYDNIVTYILSGRLSAEIFNSLPPACGGPHNFPIQTARNLMDFLQKRYSIGSVASVQKVKDAVFNLVCVLSAIPIYIQPWCIAVNKLHKTPWDFTPFEKIQRFMDSVPNHKVFDIIREEILFLKSTSMFAVGHAARPSSKLITSAIHQQSSSTSAVHTSSSSTSNSLLLDPPHQHHVPSGDQSHDGSSHPRANVALSDLVTESLSSPPIFVSDNGLTDDSSTTVLPTIAKELHCHDPLPTPGTQSQPRDSNPPKTTPTTTPGPDRYPANSLGSPWPSPAITARHCHQPPPPAASLAITAVTTTSAPVSAITSPIATTSALAPPVTPGPCQDPHHASQSRITADPTSACQAPLPLPPHHPTTACLCASSTRPLRCVTCLNLAPPRMAPGSHPKPRRCDPPLEPGPEPWALHTA